MKQVLIGILILIAMATVTNAAVYRGVTSSSSSALYDDQELVVSYRKLAIDGNAKYIGGFIPDGDPNLLTENVGFYEREGVHTTNTFDYGYSAPQGSMWLTGPKDSFGSGMLIYFDLVGANPDNANYTLEKMKIWNFNQADYHGEKWDLLDAGAKTFQCYFKDTNGAYIYTSVGGTTNDLYPWTPSIELNKAPGRDDVDFGQEIYFPEFPTNVGQVILRITSNWGELLNQVGLSEVKFYNTEPTVDPYAGVNKRAWLVDTGGQGDPNDYEVQVSLDDASLTTEGTVTVTQHWQFVNTYGIPEYTNPYEPNLADPNYVNWTPDVPYPTISDDTALNPTVTFYVPGAYNFVLSADDSGSDAEGSDAVRVDIYDVGYTGLIAHWKFDEGSGHDTYDELGLNDIIGEIDPASGEGPDWGTGIVPISDVDPTPGGALRFLGRKALDPPSPDGQPGLDDNYEALTLRGHAGQPEPYDYFTDEIDEVMATSLWVKFDTNTYYPRTNFASYMDGIISKGAWNLSMENGYMTLNLNVTRNGKPTARGLDVPEIFVRHGSTYVFDDNWHFVVLTYDGRYGKMYVDGRLDAQIDTFPGEITGGLLWDLQLGSTIWGSWEGWVLDGWLDDVKIYNIYLTQDDVAAEYEAVMGHAPCTTPLDGDLDGDCDVDLADYAKLANEWLQ